jgi:hypothetical protein
MQKFIENANGLIWTIAGTLLVLITLSGDTQRWGLIISAAALGVNVLGMILAEAVGNPDQDDNSTDEA